MTSFPTNEIKSDSQDYRVEKLEDLHVIINQLKVCDRITIQKRPKPYQLFLYFQEHAKHLRPVVCQGSLIILFTPDT